MPLTLLDKISLTTAAGPKTIELHQGDLSDLTPEEGVDILVVSAFPDDYVPSPTSLIGALMHKGVSVKALAETKAEDLRSTMSCWLSQEIPKLHSLSTIQFRRILCFEPLVRGLPSEVVGEIFRALSSFIGLHVPMSKVAMPIIATGDQRYTITNMLPPLLDAAANWLKGGMPITQLKIVAYSMTDASQAKDIFAALKGQYSAPLSDHERTPKYDIFVSYAHEDMEVIDDFVAHLRSVEPRSRIFLDKLVLNIGAAWQSTIYETIDYSRKIVAFLSPAYLSSRVCQEEFGIAQARGTKHNRNYLYPIYLRTADLPTYMEMLLYANCREAELAHVRETGTKLIGELADEKPFAG